MTQSQKSMKKKTRLAEEASIADSEVASENAGPSIIDNPFAEKRVDANMDDNVPRESTTDEAALNDKEADGVDDEVDAEKLKADEALWDSFREEFHEITEQLPLYLYRQFALMRELDERTSQHGIDLTANIQKYIDIRSKLASVFLKPPAIVPLPSDRHPIATTNHPSDAQFTGNNTDARIEEEHRAVTPLQTETAAGNSEGLAPRQTVQPEGPGTAQDAAQTEVEKEFEDETPIPWNATRTLLPQIAWLAEDVLRSSEEKVNLAQTIVDTIQLHIRQLDHSIKEQEISISFGTHKGTHPSLLEDLTAPRWHKQTTQPTMSSDAFTETTPFEPAVDEAPKTPGKKNKRGRPAAASVAQPTPNGSRTGLKLKLKLPPAAPELSSEEATTPYCVCNQPSRGTMVGCDNDDCQNGGGWFHLDCMGMDKEPEDQKWYCAECAPEFTSEPKATKRKRR